MVAYLSSWSYHHCQSWRVAIRRSACTHLHCFLCFQVDCVFIGFEGAVHATWHSSIAVERRGDDVRVPFRCWDNSNEILWLYCIKIRLQFLFDFILICSRQVEIQYKTHNFNWDSQLARNLKLFQLSQRCCQFEQVHRKLFLRLYDIISIHSIIIIDWIRSILNNLRYKLYICWQLSD